MRQIKFKAWHKTEKQFFEGSTSNMFRWIDDGQPFELMQYTGLTVKNGVELYEGDVVEWGSGNLEVVFYDTGDASFYAGTSCLESGDTFEVMGNIYENPELMEEFDNAET